MASLKASISHQSIDICKKKEDWNRADGKALMLQGHQSYRYIVYTMHILRTGRSGRSCAKNKHEREWGEAVVDGINISAGPVVQYLMLIIIIAKSKRGDKRSVCVCPTIDRSIDSPCSIQTHGQDNQQSNVCVWVIVCVCVCVLTLYSASVYIHPQFEIKFLTIIAAALLLHLIASIRFHF